MAARIHPLSQPKLDEMRRRIKATLLLKALEDHVLGGSDLKSSQIRAAETLLRKVVPDLQSVQITGADGGAVQHSIRVTFG
jgi:hypothetical protein